MGRNRPMLYIVPFGDYPTANQLEELDIAVLDELWDEGISEEQYIEQMILLQRESVLGSEIDEDVGDFEEDEEGEDEEEDDYVEVEEEDYDYNNGDAGGSNGANVIMEDDNNNNSNVDNSEAVLDVPPAGNNDSNLNVEYIDNTDGNEEAPAEGPP